MMSSRWGSPWPCHPSADGSSVPIIWAPSSLGEAAVNLQISAQAEEAFFKRNSPFCHLGTTQMNSRRAKARLRNVSGQDPQDSLFSKHPNKHGRTMLRLLCGLSMEQRATLGHLQKGDVFLAEFLKKKQPCSACIPFPCFPSAPHRSLNSLSRSSQIGQSQKDN